MTILRAAGMTKAMESALNKALLQLLLLLLKPKSLPCHVAKEIGTPEVLMSHER